ncbi:hypothetical protein PIB30_098274 [Stylosanthes scabra]|uniref:Uncharacterized protein n=1 Tax=Stylosanthes scabra TaxID=79078 RepID=A0ABU6YW22_9FABA|nr:hypothetical protein [Stylosanthes scabra]
MTTTATTSTPSLSDLQGPSIHMIPTLGVRVHSTETGGTSTQMPPPPSQPPRPPPCNPIRPIWAPTDTDGDGDDEDEQASVADDTRPLLRWDGHDCWLPMKTRTKQITTIFKSCYKWYVPHFHLAAEEAINTWWDKWKKAFKFRKGESEKMHDAWLARAAKRLQKLFHGIRERGYPSDWIPNDIFKQLKEYWASEEYLALKRTNKANRASSASGSLYTGGSITYPTTAEKMNEVFTRTHTKKKDRGQWVDKRADDTNQQYEEEIKRIEEERAALIAAGCLEPPDRL